MTKTIITLSLLALLAAPLAACNTMEGLGKDTQAAGEAIKTSASQNKGY